MNNGGPTNYNLKHMKTVTLIYIFYKYILYTFHTYLIHICVLHMDVTHIRDISCSLHEAVTVMMIVCADDEITRDRCVDCGGPILLVLPQLAAHNCSQNVIFT